MFLGSCLLSIRTPCRQDTDSSFLGLDALESSPWFWHNRTNLSHSQQTKKNSLFIALCAADLTRHTEIYHGCYHSCLDYIPLELDLAHWYCISVSPEPFLLAKGSSGLPAIGG